MNKPKALRPGMTLGIIAPSGAPRNEKALPDMVNFWINKGYNIVLGKSCTARHGNLAGTDDVRAGDINSMFADPVIDGILCLRGGYGAARTLPLIDFDCIRRNPKIFVGYSDVTALHNAINRYGNLVTFHGPMGDIAGDDEGCALSYQDLITALTITGCRALCNPPEYGYTTLTGGKATGVLTGGNLTLVSHSLGTPYAPDFAGKILFLEDIGEHTYRVDEMLVHLRQSGAFDQCAGILLGEFTDCTVEYPAFGLTLEEVFDELLPKDKPVLRGIRVGHCQPKLTLPLGVPYEMDAALQTVVQLEGAVG